MLEITGKVHTLDGNGWSLCWRGIYDLPSSIIFCYTRRMNTKAMIWIGIFVGGAIGSGLGNLLDHQSFFSLTNFGGWNIILSAVGSIAGIWAGYKASRL